MAFKRLNFTKSWLSPTDFPTEEDSEAQVRADLQLLHDEAGTGLNGLMEALEAASAAESLGARDEFGVRATIQDLLTRLTALLSGVTRLDRTIAAGHDGIPTSGAVYSALQDAIHGRLVGDYSGIQLMDRATGRLYVLHMNAGRLSLEERPVQCPRCGRSDLRRDEEMGYICSDRSRCGWTAAYDPDWDGVDGSVPEDPGPAGEGEISFTVKSYDDTYHTCVAAEGMTWQEFAGSAYNTVLYTSDYNGDIRPFKVYEDLVFYSHEGYDEGPYVTVDVSAADVIESGRTYENREW